MKIAFIEWQSAAMLWGLAALALPVIAHLLSRSGSHRIALPTARFLALAQAQRGRRVRLSQWLVLLLRIAMVALIVLAFARPGWRAGGREESSDSGREVVIVLDASASLGRVADGGDLFARAVDRGREILDGLDAEHDRAALVLAGVTIDSALPRLSSNFTALRRALDVATVSVGSANLADAMRLAARLPGAGGSSSSASQPRRLILITDAQATHLQDLLGLVPEPGLTDLSIESIAADPHAGNLAITSLALSPARPTAGHPFTVSADITNHGPRPATIQVQCELQPAPLAPPRPALVTIEPDAVSTAQFACQMDQSGAVQVRVSLPPDGLDADNTMIATAPIRQTMRVLILSRDSAQPLSTVSHLAAALHPDDQSPYAATTVDPSHAGVESVDWDTLDAAILCESGRVPLDWLTRLDRFARDGGGLWWFIDSPESAAATDVFASIDSDAPGLPLQVRDPLTQPVREQWGSADPLHPALSSFDGPALGALIGVRHLCLTNVGVAPGAAVLIRGSDGSPIVAVRAMGRGRALAFNGSIARDSTTLTREPLFPAIVHEWMAWLCGSEQPLTVVHPGREALIELPASVPPNATLRIEPSRPFTESVAGGRRIVRLSEQEEVGEIRILDAASGAWVAGAGVTIDPRESDLRPADASTLAVLQGATTPGDGERPPHETDSASLGGRRKLIEFWPWLLLAACLGAIAEGFITMRTARREVRP